jgi:hypothetical protein
MTFPHALGNERTNKPFKIKRPSQRWRLSMSSKKQTRTLHGNKTNLLGQAIACDDGYPAAKIIQNGSGSKAMT